MRSTFGFPTALRLLTTKNVRGKALTLWFVDHVLWLKPDGHGNPMVVARWSRVWPQESETVRLWHWSTYQMLYIDDKGWQKYKLLTPRYLLYTPKQWSPPASLSRWGQIPPKMYEARPWLASLGGPRDVAGKWMVLAVDGGRWMVPSQVHRAVGFDIYPW